jgi:hypothetical protein
LVHVAADMKTALIRASMNHSMNEPAIVVEGKDELGGVEA